MLSTISSLRHINKEAKGSIINNGFPIFFMPKIPELRKGDIERIIEASKRKPERVVEIYEEIRREFNQVYDRDQELGKLNSYEASLLRKEYEERDYPTREMIGKLKTIIEREELVIQRIESHRKKVGEFFSSHKQDLDRKSIKVLEVMIQRYNNIKMKL